MVKKIKDQRLMQFNKKIGALFIVLLPSCIPPRSFNKKMNQVNRWSEHHLNITTVAHSSPVFQSKDVFQSRDIERLSLSRALSIAFQSSNQLQAELQGIGIKSGDLIQAGFYSNPSVGMIFRLPKPAEQTNIEVAASFRLSDLWQVPLRKKVAEKELEEKTSQILAHIVQFRKEIIDAYYDALFTQVHLMLLKKSIHWFEELNKKLQVGYQYGYQTQLDIHLAAAQLQRQEVLTIEKQGELHAKFIQLQATLGIPQDHLSIKQLLPPPLPPVSVPLSELTNWALNEHPRIQMLQNKIDRTRRTISYEKSRVVDNVQVGIAYERDFDKKTTGVGPAISFDLPFLDTNYGAIERAKHELQQAEYEFKNTQVQVQSDIRAAYMSYHHQRKAINQFIHAVLPEFEAALAYANHYVETMQLPGPVYLNTQISYVNSHEQLLNMQKKAALLFNELESAVGKLLA